MVVPLFLHYLASGEIRTEAVLLHSIRDDRPMVMWSYYFSKRYPFELVETGRVELYLEQGYCALPNQIHRMKNPSD
jgi:hypothetical protein